MNPRLPIFISLVLATVMMATVGGPFPAKAARNPFIGSQKEQEPSAQHLEAGYPGFLQPAMQKIATFQLSIRQQMVRLVGNIRRHPLGRSFQVFMLLSFLYGMIHALGPGHGKVYACGYFLNRGGTIRNGLLFSGLTMLMHVFSGTTLILGGALVLKTSGAMTLENAAPVMERISYAALLVVGLFLAASTFTRLRSGAFQAPDTCPEKAGGKSMFLVALAIGIVPCPGAALVLLFSLTMGIVATGLAAMVSIAAGMAITTSLFALLTIGLQNRLLRPAAIHHRLFKSAFILVSLGGATCIAALGAVLLLGSF
jgi:nickel/cobalt exporter